MSDTEDLLRAALLDPDLDRDTGSPDAARALLAGVLVRQSRLRRRRQHLTTIGAVAAAVAVLSGVAAAMAAGSAAPSLEPARQPELVIIPTPTPTPTPAEMTPAEMTPAPSPATIVPESLTAPPISTRPPIGQDSGTMTQPAQRPATPEPTPDVVQVPLPAPTVPRG
jgi:hypothetical protein